MKNEIEYAVQEAFSMNLSTEQAIKFIMRVAPMQQGVCKQSIAGIYSTCRNGTLTEDGWLSG